MQKTDDMLQYYFLFFSGQYMFFKKKYIDAINYYKLAEDKLIKIEDEIEKAEFYYHLAISYYNMIWLNDNKIPLFQFHLQF